MNAQNDTSSLTYKDAGVDIKAGDTFVQAIKTHAKNTRRNGVIGGIGGFGGLFELPLANYQHPLLVSATDGVGTKLKLAIELAKHDTIGIDLVAMCVNDIIVSGAEPLFFLDYFATGKLDLEQGEAIIKGISEGCKQANVALLGGETAEMPGMYQHQDYDLAGFCVGIVEKSKVIDGSTIVAGDCLIALASSGLHSNGYSLVRKILQQQNISLQEKFAQQSLGEELLQPTRIYVKTILNLMQEHQLLGLAHITGGGITENLPRILPDNVRAVIHAQSWQWPQIFNWLQTNGNIQLTEMYRTFNCGVGMILCVRPQIKYDVLKFLQSAGEIAWEIGAIASRQGNEDAVVFLSS